MTHRTRVVADGVEYRATCLCGWQSRQTWFNKQLAIADGNGHFIFADLADNPD